MSEASNQRYYFLDRANTARKLARQAGDTHIAAIHLDMAARYEKKAADLVTTMRARIVPG